MRQLPIVPIDVNLRSDEILEFEEELKNRIVNQDEAIQAVSSIYERCLAGMLPPNRPLGNLLLLGCTGTGKTRLVEALAEVLYKDAGAMLKINCTEYQSAHEVSKLIGAPPSYVGHGEKSGSSQLSQEKLEQHFTADTKISIVLFDEIEKASGAFHELLLNILDKGILNTGRGDTIDFTKSIIIMTSNIGATELSQAQGPKLGFHNVKPTQTITNNIVTNAARKKFSPEFINRLDKMVVFNNLDKDQMRSILKVELRSVQRRIFAATNHCQFVLTLNKNAEDFIIESGFDIRYGARHLKRSIEKNIVDPLANLVLTHQIEMGDVVHIEVRDDKLSFNKLPASAVIQENNESDFFEFIEHATEAEEVEIDL